MKLRYLVPALGVLASLSTVSAETIGGLTVGGYVDVIATAGHSSVDDASDQTDVEFTSFVELRVGYKVADNVTAQIDLEFDGANSRGDDVNVAYLEQAFINWAITDGFSLTGGKFTTYAGWVAADADGLYRINAGPITSLYGGEITGAAGNFVVNEEFNISVFLVNGLDVVSGGNSLTPDTAAIDSENDDLALAVDAVYKMEGIGSFNLEAGYDYLSADISEFSIGLNATITAVENLTLGAEIITRMLDVDGVSLSALGALAMGNYKLSTTQPMSVTGMLQYVSYDEGDIGDGETASVLELAVALLTNPTNNPNFGLNYEISYATVSDDGVVVENVGDPSPFGFDKQNDLRFSIELLALIP